MKKPCRNHKLQGNLINENGCKKVLRFSQFFVKALLSCAVHHNRANVMRAISGCTVRIGVAEKPTPKFTYSFCLPSS